MALIYLSGPISLNGTLPETEIEKNVARFKRAKGHLEMLGNEVLSPAELPKQDSWEDYMKLCFPMVCRADEVYVLPGFGDSRGPVLEVLVAQSCGIPVKEWHG